MGKTEGTVYLIHLDSPMGHASHYIGWALLTKYRLRHHRNGTGSRFLAVAVERGITFDIVREWPGDRHLERRLKNRKNAAQLCPICNPPKKKTNEHDPDIPDREKSGAQETDRAAEQTQRANQESPGRVECQQEITWTEDEIPF